MMMFIIPILFIVIYRNKVIIHIMKPSGKGLVEVKSKRVSMGEKDITINKTIYNINLEDAVILNFMVFFTIHHLFFEEGKVNPITNKADSKSGTLLYILVHNRVLSQLFGSEAKIESLLYVCIAASLIAMIVGIYAVYQVNNMNNNINIIMQNVIPKVIK